ncbi:MAG: histidine phosphatase family protein [Pseudomonadota bacterium]
MTTPVIYFIRHGQTDWNAEERFQGQKDIPLNDFGREQAARNGRVLREYLQLEDLRFVASPMARAIETMEIVRHNLGLEPQDYALDDRLMELSFGAWEGQTLADLVVKEPDLWQARRADKWNFVPPEGESYEMLTQRVAAWLDAVKEPSVVVSHGGVNRALRALLTGDRSNEMASAPTPQDQIMIVTGNDIRWL